MLRRPSLGLAIAAFLGLATPAGATLVQGDLLAAGDGLLTLDSTTGLQWLDVTASLGLSWDDVGADVGGWITLGFRHATYSEVCDLFSREGFQGQDCQTAPDTTDPTILANVVNLMSLLGRTGGGGPSDAQNNLDGLYDLGFVSGTLEGGGLRTTPKLNPTEARIRMSNRFPMTGDRNSEVGHYLILAPEPSAALLIIGASVALAGMARRRSTRSRASCTEG